MVQEIALTFRFCFVQKFYAILSFPLRATCLSNLTLLHLIIQIMFGRKHKLMKRFVMLLFYRFHMQFAELMH
jgi:hypothetical protein